MNFPRLLLLTAVLFATPFAVRAQQTAASSSSAPLPDIRQLIQQVTEHQKQLDRVREDYTYTSLTTTEDLDSSGRVTKSESEESEEFFVNGHQISRIVKKNGQPLAGKDLDKETARVTARVQKAEQTKADQTIDPHTISIRKMLESVDVRNPRRIQFRGRPTIVFDFTGRRDAKAHNIEENLSKKLEGTLWIDEADRQVARIEVRCFDNIHFGGGLLANIQKGSNFTFEQAPVGHGLWMPTEGMGQFQARLLLVKGIRQRFHERDTEYKRFHAEAQQGKGATTIGNKSGVH